MSPFLVSPGLLISCKSERTRRPFFPLWCLFWCAASTAPQFSQWHVHEMRFLPKKKAVHHFKQACGSFVGEIGGCERTEGGIKRHMWIDLQHNTAKHAFLSRLVCRNWQVLWSASRGAQYDSSLTSFFPMISFNSLVFTAFEFSSKAEFVALISKDWRRQR